MLSESNEHSGWRRRLMPIMFQPGNRFGTIQSAVCESCAAISHCLGALLSFAICSGCNDASKCLYFSLTSLRHRQNAAAPGLHSYPSCLLDESRLVVVLKCRIQLSMISLRGTWATKQLALTNQSYSLFVQGNSLCLGSKKLLSGLQKRDRLGPEDKGFCCSESPVSSSLQVCFCMPTGFAAPSIACAACSPLTALLWNLVHYIQAPSRPSARPLLVQKAAHSCWRRALPPPLLWHRARPAFRMGLLEHGCTPYTLKP